VSTNYMIKGDKTVGRTIHLGNAPVTIEGFGLAMYHQMMELAEYTTANPLQPHAQGESRRVAGMTMVISMAETIALITGAVLRYAYESNLNPDTILLELPAVRNDGAGHTRVEASGDKFSMWKVINVNPQVHPAGFGLYKLTLGLKDRTKAAAAQTGAGVGSNPLGGLMGAPQPTGPCTAFAYKHKVTQYNQFSPLSHAVVQRLHAGVSATSTPIQEVPDFVLDAYDQSFRDIDSHQLVQTLRQCTDPAEITRLTAQLKPNGRPGGSRPRPDNRQNQWTAGYDLMRFRNAENAEASARQLYEELMRDSITPEDAWDA